MKNIFIKIRADKALSLSRDRTLVTKAPPTEKHLSDSTEVGLTDIMALNMSSKKALLCCVASNSFMSWANDFGRSLSLLSSDTSDNYIH